MTHNHNWSRVGIWETETEAIYPCLSLDCPAAQLRTPGQDISTGQTLDNRLAEIVAAFDGLCFDDDPAGGAVKVIMTEAVESYKFHKMKFKPGDVVIDIGAHVGVVSIFLARRNPGVTVYAFEPVRANFVRLCRNIEANGITNVIPINRAVTGDGRRLALRVNPESNSAGGSAYVSESAGETVEADSLTLSQIFEQYKINRCRLLKIDCEGAEYETLLNTPAEILSRVDHLRGEFHTNKRLRKAGYKPAALRKWLRQWIKSVKTDTCKMAE